MTEILEKIAALATPIIEHNGAFLTDIDLRGELRSKVLEVYVDTDEGITIDRCTAISRELSEALDAQEIIAGEYRLDVSSPDLGRPVRVLRQYKKNIGRIFSVTFVEDGVEHKLEGKAEGADEHGVTVRSDAATVKTIPLAAIAQALIVPQLKKSK